MKRKKTSVEIFAAAPAVALDLAVREAERIVPTKKFAKKTNAYWKALGPGLTTGASDDDPSGIATYSQTGAQFGFNFLWTAGFTFPLMATVQEMCARIGIVTGRGLAGNIRLHFSKRILFLSAWLLFMANAFNIGANIGAMGKAAQLLVPSLNFHFMVVFFTALSLGIQVFYNYAKLARYLKWLALVLFAYIASALLANIDWVNVLQQAVVPHIGFGKDEIIILCAILGTTISPYLFFWQTSQEVEDEISRGKKLLKSRQGSNLKDIWRMRFDVWVGMLLSNVVMFFIIASSAAILHANGVTEITSAAQAAEALRPFAGEATYFLFALGIIGTGLLALPVLAGSSAYALAEAYHWKEGLSKPLNKAYSFYGAIIVSMLVGMSINFTSLNPFKALVYAGVANGIVAPIVLTLTVLLASNRKVMGKWVNGPVSTIVGWVTVALMTVVGLAAMYAMFS